jgi:hypothetical protein
MAEMIILVVRVLVNPEFEHYTCEQDPAFYVWKAQLNSFEAQASPHLPKIQCGRSLRGLE